MVNPNQLNQQDIIWVTTVIPIVRSKKGVTEPQPLKVDLVAKNINLFINNMQRVLEETPEELGKFQFTEFTINAEISGSGTISIMGTGIETTGTAGLTFKFERKHKP